jgi:hypothetical protein
MEYIAAVGVAEDSALISQKLVRRVRFCRIALPIGPWFSAAVMGVLLCAAVTETAFAGAARPLRVEGATVSANPAARVPTRTTRRPIDAARVESVALGAVDLQRALSAADGRERRGSPHRIGIARSIPELATQASTNARLRWQATPDGGAVAAIVIRSNGALGVRLGVQVLRLPPSATLRFYGSAGAQAHETSGEAVLNIIQRNRDAGDLADEASTYWPPLIEGDHATLEIEVPPGVGTGAVAIAVPRLSHLFASPLVGRTAGLGASAGCEIDASCFAEWRPESDATARMVFVWAGGTYECTGTLVNDSASSGSPYLLTAYHCIPNQSAASTIQTYWSYRSSSCNSGFYNPSYQIRTGGATLLYSSPATDTAFMLLRDPPPVGARFAGWTSESISLGSSVISLHHPGGDLQKIVFGQLDGFADCSEVNAGQFLCNEAFQATGEFLVVGYTSGIQEIGSSGSGLFSSINGSRYLIGQLYGGEASCLTPAGAGYFGRFDVAYNAAMNRWLDRPAGRGRDDLVVDFGAASGLWMWLNNATWQQLHSVTAKLVATADMDFNGRDDVIVYFGNPYGIWVWMNNTNWVQLHGISAQRIVRADMDGNGQDDVVIDFGPPYGIWVRMNDSNWVQLHGISAKSITAADMDNNGMDDLVIDFGAPYGIWERMNNRNWVQLHGVSARSISTADMDKNGMDDVVIDFGAPYGIWVRMNNSNWVQLHGETASSIAAIDVDNNGMVDVVIDFGPQYGIWVRMNNSSWRQLHGASARHIATADLDGNGMGDVIVDFGSAGGGILAWMNNAYWQQWQGVGANSITAGQIGN